MNRRVRSMNVRVVPRHCRGEFLRAAHSIIVYQRKAVERCEPLASLETVQLDDKRASNHVPAEFAHQRHRRLRRAAGREQVVGDQNSRPIHDSVLMYLQGRASVLEIVSLIVKMKWQLARLARNWEPDSEPIRNRRTDDKTARLDSQHHVHRAEIRLRHLIDHRRKPARIANQRRDVPEHDPRLRKIRNITNKLFNFLSRHLSFYLARYFVWTALIVYG